MRIGIIEYTEEEGLTEICCSVSRYNVVRNQDTLGIRVISSAYAVIYLVAELPHTAVFDIEIPAPLTGVTLENALRFELEQLIPLPLEQVSWNFRRLSSGIHQFRICATRRDEIDAILEKLAAAGLCCDYVLPSQLLLKPSVTSSAETVSPSELLLGYLPGDPTGKKLHLRGDLVPPRLRPPRNRRGRLLYQILTGCAVLLLFLLLVVRFRQFSSEYRMLQEEHAVLEQKLQETENFSKQLVQMNELAQRIKDAKIGTASVLPILADLNERLPEYMYLANYQQNADQIDLVIVSTHDDPNLPRILLGSKLYQSDLRKTVQPDSQVTTFNVTLRSLLP